MYHSSQQMNLFSFLLPVEKAVPVVYSIRSGNILRMFIYQQKKKETGLHREGSAATLTLLLMMPAQDFLLMEKYFFSTARARICSRAICMFPFLMIWIGRFRKNYLLP